MNTDPQQIRAEVDDALAGIPQIGPDTDIAAEEIDIDTVGRRLEQAHQILVDALESVEKS